MQALVMQKKLPEGTRGIQEPDKLYISAYFSKLTVFLQIGSVALKSFVLL